MKVEAETIRVSFARKKKQKKTCVDCTKTVKRTGQKALLNSKQEFGKVTLFKQFLEYLEFKCKKFQVITDPKEKNSRRFKLSLKTCSREYLE